MGPYVTANTVLIGVFAFAAVHYFLLWWFSRNERVLLLFAATSAAGAILQCYIVRLATSTTVEQYAAAMQQRTNWGLVGITLTAWVLGEVPGIRARAFVRFVTAVLGSAILLNLLGFSLTVPIEGLRQARLPWGESFTLARRPPPPWWGVPIYAVVLSVDAFGLYAGARLWRRDRVAGVLIIVASISAAAAALTGVVVDLLRKDFPYVGDLPYAVWIVIVGVLLGREYRRRREALADSEERYRLIVANQTEFIVKWLPDGTRTFVNDSYCRYFGVTRAECVGTSFIPLVAPDFRRGIYDMVASLTPQNPFAVEEHLAYDARGDLRWQEWRCRGIFDAAGKLIELVSTGRDITERRSTEETLRRNEERYRLLTEQAKVVLWEGDPETLLFTYVSDSAEHLLGIPAEEWYRPGFWPEHIYDEDREWALESCQTSTARREDHRFEYRMVRADGTVIWVEDSVRVIVDADDKVSLRGLLIDITQRKAADEELRQSRQLFGSAFESAPVGMAIVGLDGRLLQVNRAICRMLGFSDEELRATNAQAITHPDDLEADLALLHKLLAGEIPYYELEKRYLHRDGRIIWGLLFVSLVRDAGGNPAYLVAQVQDMTERRRLEEQLRHSQKMEAIGRLAGGIAHDFNNIITVVSTYGGLLRERLPADDFNREAVQAVLDAADRASRLTRQILAFSRKQLLQPTVVELNHVVRDIEPLLARLVAQGVELHVELAAEPCPVKCDRQQLEQVLLNLAVNARDAMPSGGRLSIGVRVVSAADVVEAGGDDPTVSSYVELAVSDTGAGIDDETRSHIFEPFFTTKAAGRGTGLGLSVVYGIVRQCGGHIEVESGVGVGTTFYVRIPRAGGPATSSEAEQDSAAGDGETILLVDDENTVRTAVQDMLEEAGYRVVAASDAEAAVAALQFDGDIQLLLTDLIMPGIGGRELVAMARAVRPRLPVVVMSGRHDELAKVPFTEAAAVVEKPFLAVDLMAAIRRVLETPDDAVDDA